MLLKICIQRGLHPKKLHCRSGSSGTDKDTILDNLFFNSAIVQYAKTGPIS